MGIIDNIIGYFRTLYDILTVLFRKLIGRGGRAVTKRWYYFPGADYEFIVLDKKLGKLHMGLYPHKVVFEKRNLAAKVLNGQDKTDMLMGLASEGNFYREIPLSRFIGAEFRSEGMRTRIVIRSMFERLDFTVTTTDARKIRNYVSSRQ